MKQVRRLHHEHVQRFQLKRLLCQIDRFFNNLIQASPYINYRLDLFDAGLKDNPATNLPLAEKRRIFEEYLTKWNALSFTPKKMQDICGSNSKPLDLGFLDLLLRMEPRSSS